MPSRLIRVANVDDMKDVAAIQRSIHPPYVMSAASWRHSLTILPERARSLFLVAVVDGAVAGFMRAFLNLSTQEQGAANLRLCVLPLWRRQGIGAELYAAADLHLQSISASSTRIWVPDEEASKAFASSRGFEFRRSLRYSCVDPRVLPPMPDVPPSVTLTDLASAGPEAVYEWDIVASADEPHDTAYSPQPFDDWTRQYWNDPDHRPGLGIAAMVEGKVVAGTGVDADGDHSVSGFTGVLPEFRGRGLAKLVKSASLRRVAEAGITHAYTSNDDTNAPMLAVNEWLGYRPVLSAHLYRR